MLEFQNAGIDVEVCGESRVDLKSMMEILYERDVYSVLCEGGGELANSMLELDLVDQFFVYRTDETVKGDGASFSHEVLDSEPLYRKRIGMDKLQVFDLSVI